MRPEGATHIDSEFDYWKVISDDESYFHRPSGWIRYVLRTSTAKKKYKLKPL